MMELHNASAKGARNLTAYSSTHIARTTGLGTDRRINAEMARICGTGNMPTWSGAPMLTNALRSGQL